MDIDRLLKLLPSPYPTSLWKKEDILGTTYSPLGHLSPDDNESRVSGNANAMRTGEHWTIAGATGSGKTVFMRELLEQLRRRYPRARRYVLNSTADTQFDDVVGCQEFLSNAVPKKLDPTYTQVWTPDTDDMGAYNKWLLDILYAREEAIVLLDDIASLVGYGRSISILDGHMRLMKQGRKHGITVINGTQEMTRVPLMMFRQMTHFVQMRLGNDPTDLAYARRYLGMEKENQRPPRAEYGLFYKRVGVRYPYEEYESFNHFFHRRKTF